MVSTRLSLLQQAQEGNETAWEQLSQTYQPLISWWLQRQRIKPHDAEEIGQEVMLVVLRRLVEFDHSGNVGAFRSWLRTITSNQLRTFARKHFKQPSTGHAEFFEQIAALKDDSSESSQLWDQQYNQILICRLLEWVSESVEPRTVDLFKKLVLDEIPATELAKQMGISVGSVYSAKSRVMRRIRQAGSDLIDDTILD